jgi:uncharacterized protein involved in exopolysaccharide biosynthesis
MFGVPIATLLVPATLQAYRQPDTYDAKAVVRVRQIVQGGRVDLPEEAGSDVGATVIMTPDRLFATPNLRTVVPILLPGADPDDPRVLDQARRMMSFESQSPITFFVRAVHVDPERPSKAVNRLVETFIENERREPLRKAESKREFRERQLEDVSADYARKLATLNEFDRKHAETLPAQRESLRQDLDALRSEMDIRRQLAQSAKSRIDFLTEQISFQTANPTSPRPDDPKERELALEQRIRAQETALGAAERQLAVARGRYTDKHPNVVGLTQEIAALTADVAASRTALEAARSEAASRRDDAKPATESSSVQLMRTLRESATQEHERAVAELAALKEQQAPLLARLARMPYTAAERETLQKEVAKAEAERAEAQRLVDELTQLADYTRLSDASEVTPYAVQQWASVPLAPSGPDRKKTILTAVGIGAVVGYGLVLLRKRFHAPTVFRPEDLLGLARGALIVSVPLLPSGQRTRRRWIPRVPAMDLALGAWVVACLGVSMLAVLAHSGSVVLPGWLHGVMGVPA